ncbi:unnamed protein product [Polarella glacialis]|uniref:Uncharacterized protein n=1 Tax=Polarella glacialis TaxID=89957 RepID=A0A813K8F8_POLGL|nr:unnamed protein product [Polarella glacialis]
MEHRELGCRVFLDATSMGHRELSCLGIFERIPLGQREFSCQDLFGPDTSQKPGYQPSVLFDGIPMRNRELICRVFLTYYSSEAGSSAAVFLFFFCQQQQQQTQQQTTKTTTSSNNNKTGQREGVGRQPVRQGGLHMENLTIPM